MPKRAGKRRSFKQVVNCDLELRPLMNVFIVLIPMLLMSAVFIEIRVIEMSLPQQAVAQARPSDPFEVAIRIREDVYVVETNGVPIRSVPRGRSSPTSVPAVEALGQLASVLRGIEAAHPENKEIRIIAESRTHYREIVAVMDLARAAGLPQAALEGEGT